MNELAVYDYELPEELIAAHPLENRSDSRMLVVEKTSGVISHHHVSDLPEFLKPWDCLVLNDTKVLPARLFGVRAKTGGKWEGLFLGVDPDGHWKLIGQTRGRLLAGEQLEIAPACAITDPSQSPRLRLTLVSQNEEGAWLAKPDLGEDFVELLNTFGTMPLPPYIKRPIAQASDFERYQTTYARHPGAVAAPTAGLHLTTDLLEQCTAKRIEKAFVTLHVGIGTFRPITATQLSEHHMHSEWCEVTPEAVAKIQRAKQQGGRIAAVGTTSVRTLESASQIGFVQPFRGETNLFIRPGYVFQTVDLLLTNFHLPQSTLLVLVSTLAGHELIRTAYQEAIREGYRFYSYGDAMLIV